MSTYLSDILTLTAEACNIPCSPLSDYSEDGVNEMLDEVGYAGFPMLIFSTKQSGTMAIERNGKVYLEYTVSLIFANAVDSHTTNTANNLQVMDDMTELGAQYMQRLIKQDAYKKHPSNSEPLRPSYNTFELRYDVELVGVEFRFTLRIDPSQDINSCD